MTFTGQSFADALAAHKLVAARCDSCSQLYVPPRPMCSTCFGNAMSRVEMSGAGKLLAFTTVHIGSTAMIAAGYDRDKPYCVGIIELDEGPAISGQILGVDPGRPEEIHIGSRVEADFVSREGSAEGEVFLAFRPIE